MNIKYRRSKDGCEILPVSCTKMKKRSQPALTTRHLSLMEWRARQGNSSGLRSRKKESIGLHGTETHALGLAGYVFSTHSTPNVEAAGAKEQRRPTAAAIARKNMHEYKVNMYCKDGCLLLYALWGGGGGRHRLTQACCPITINSHIFQGQLKLVHALAATAATICLVVVVVVIGGSAAAVRVVAPKALLPICKGRDVLHMEKCKTGALILSPNSNHKPCAPVGGGRSPVSSVSH